MLRPGDELIKNLGGLQVVNGIGLFLAIQVAYMEPWRISQNYRTVVSQSPYDGKNAL